MPGLRNHMPAGAIDLEFVVASIKSTTERKDINRDGRKPKSENE